MLRIGQAYWFVSENDEVEQGRLISANEGPVVCYLFHGTLIHFANINEVYRNEGDARVGLEYVLKRRAKAQ